MTLIGSTLFSGKKTAIANTIRDDASRTVKVKLPVQAAAMASGTSRRQQRLVVLGGNTGDYQQNTFCWLQDHAVDKWQVLQTPVHENILIVCQTDDGFILYSV